MLYFYSSLLLFRFIYSNDQQPLGNLPSQSSATIPHFAETAPPPTPVDPQELEQQKRLADRARRFGEHAPAADESCSVSSTSVRVRRRHRDPLLRNMPD